MYNAKAKVGSLILKYLLYSESDHMGFHLSRQLKGFILSVNVDNTMYWPLINSHLLIYSTNPITKE